MHGGTCKLCGQRCRYITLYNRAYWVHDETGDHIDFEPVRHDCNTYIVRDEVSAS